MCFGLWKWKGSAVMASLSTVNLMINYTYIYIYIILFVPNIFRTWSLFKWASCSLVSAAEMYSTWFGRSFQSAAFNQRLVVWIPREFRMQGMVTYRKHTPRIPKQQPKTRSMIVWSLVILRFILCHSTLFSTFCSTCFIQSVLVRLLTRQEKINLRDHFFRSVLQP